MISRASDFGASLHSQFTITLFLSVDREIPALDREEGSGILTKQRRSFLLVTSICEEAINKIARLRASVP